jgi:hypothetical protein
VRFWAALSLILCALLLGTTFAHLLEIRAKARMDGALWTTLQHNLYRAFATVGGTVEIGAILATAGLAWSAYGGRGRWVALGAWVCFVAAFAPVWIGVVAPVNREVARWTPGSVPTDWTRWRRRWDLGHAVRFGLHLIGFGLLVALLVFGGVPARSS